MTDQNTPDPPVEPTEEELWAEFEEKESGEEKPKFAENGESANDTFAEQEAAPDEPLPEEEAPDIWADAPPDLKAAHDAQVRALRSAQTEHARRSIEGRIAAYTRRLHERNAAAQQQPVQEQEAADPLAELAADYPEIATPLQQKLAPISEKLSQFDAQMRSRQEAADLEMDAELRANEQLLEFRHPGWDQFLHDNGAAFGAWIVDQPLYYRQAFVTNQEAIIDPYSAIETLDAFKDFVVSTQQPPQEPQQAPPVKQQGLNPRRAAQLAGSASPHSAGSRPTVSGIPEDADDETLWKAWAAVDPDERKYRSA